jgi:sodium/hydrogen antiporter
MAAIGGQSLPLSLPISCVSLGAALSAGDGRAVADAFPEITERFIEFFVVIAFIGVGLKLDQTFGGTAGRSPRDCCASPCRSASWRSRHRSVVAGPALDHRRAARSSLVPTDPVLASDDQVGPPKSAGEDEVRVHLR